MEYDLVSLYAAEADRRTEGLSFLQKIVSENADKVGSMSEDDKLYYEAAKYVASQVVDHTGKRF